MVNLRMQRKQRYLRNRHICISINFILFQISESLLEGFQAKYLNETIRKKEDAISDICSSILKVYNNITL